MTPLYYPEYEDDLLMTQYGSFAYINDVDLNYVYGIRVNLIHDYFQWFDLYTQDGILDLSGEDSTRLFVIG